MYKTFRWELGTFYKPLQAKNRLPSGRLLSARQELQRWSTRAVAGWCWRNCWLFLQKGSTSFKNFSPCYSLSTDQQYIADIRRWTHRWTTELTTRWRAQESGRARRGWENSAKILWGLKLTSSETLTKMIGERCWERLLLKGLFYTFYMLIEISWTSLVRFWFVFYSGIHVSFWSASLGLGSGGTASKWQVAKWPQDPAGTMDRYWYYIRHIYFQNLFHILRNATLLHLLTFSSEKVTFFHPEGKHHHFFLGVLSLKPSEWIVCHVLRRDHKVPFMVFCWFLRNEPLRICRKNWMRDSWGVCFFSPKKWSPAEVALKSWRCIWNFDFETLIKTRAGNHSRQWIVLKYFFCSLEWFHNPVDIWTWKRLESTL